MRIAISYWVMTFSNSCARWFAYISHLILKKTFEWELEFIISNNLRLQEIFQSSDVLVALIIFYSMLTFSLVVQLRICLQCRRPRFNLWVGKLPWRREWQLIPVFFPGDSHEQRNLAGCSPWGHKEQRLSN